MIFADTSFLIDFLDDDRSHHDAAETYMAEQVGPDEIIGIPTPVLYELYRGAAIVNGEDGITQMTADLNFAEFIDQTPGAAAEAARIYSQLRAEGNMINQGDIVIAGIVRDYGGRLVAGDGDFDAVPGLRVDSY